MNTQATISDPFRAPPVGAPTHTAPAGNLASIDITNDQPPTFARLVQTELRKIRDTRSGLAVLGTIAGVGLVILIVMLILLATNSVDRLSFGSFVTGADVMATMLFPSLVVLLVTSEWSQRTAMTTFALVPNRGRVLAAKFSAAMCMTLAIAATVIASAAIANLMSPAVGNSPLNWNVTWADLGVFLLTYVWSCTLAFAVATLVLNSAAGLVSYYVIRLGVSTMLYLAALVKVFEPIVPWINPDALSKVMEDPSVGSSWARLGVVSLLWIGIPLVLGVRRVLRTEIK